MINRNTPKVMDRKTEVAAIAATWAAGKPAFERKLARLDPDKDKVRRVLLNAYLARMEHALYCNSEGDAARIEIEEINELAPWVNHLVKEISWKQELGLGLYEIHCDSGLTHAESYAALAEGRKRNPGRPVDVTAIDALQMKLDGKSISEIADSLCDYLHNREAGPYHHDSQDSQDGNGCYQRFQKSIIRIQVIYDKCKPLD